MEILIKNQQNLKPFFNFMLTSLFLFAPYYTFATTPRILDISDVIRIFIYWFNSLMIILNIIYFLIIIILRLFSKKISIKNLIFGELIIISFLTLIIYCLALFLHSQFS